MGMLSQNWSCTFEGRVRKAQKQLPCPPRAEVMKLFYGSPSLMQHNQKRKPTPGKNFENFEKNGKYQQQKM